MGKVFLGKPFHWALIVALIAGGWFVGSGRLHVIWFNLFTMLLLAVSIVAVILVLWTSKPGEQVTRDPLEEE